MAEQHSAIRWLHEYGRRYPDAWEQYARLLDHPPMQWPSWCYCPLAGAYAIVSRGQDLPPEKGLDVSSLGAVAAWRATQGIYRIYPTLLEELLDTPISGDVPADVLMRLPEWCVYVETPLVDKVAGFFAFLECDATDGRVELRLLLDLVEPRALVPQIVHLGHGSLKRGFEQALQLACDNARRQGMEPELLRDIERSAAGNIARLERLVSVLLYLCAGDAEVPSAAERPPRVVRGKKRALLPIPKHGATVHDCGLRMGAALDLARARRDDERDRGGASGTVMPHIRRAHWHTFWTGPRDGERVARVRWMPPIGVNLDSVPEFAVVRPVGGEDVRN